MPTPQLLVVDFGSQYTQLIARRVRELGVYCEVCLPQAFEPAAGLKGSKSLKRLKGLKGIILSGGPYSVLDADAPQFAWGSLPEGVVVLAICYAAQLAVHNLGGQVIAAKQREFGQATIQHQNSTLLQDLPALADVWMSHSDSIAALPAHFTAIASTDDIPYAAYQGTLPCGNSFFGLQFHPEVAHTPQGTAILARFINHCACVKDWTNERFIEQSIAHWEKEIPQDAEVLMGLSGGVDSSIAAVLLRRAIGRRLRAFFVDNGLLRQGEAQQVCATYADMGLDVELINAQGVFYQALDGLTDAEDKRKAIGRTFVEVFEQQQQRYPALAYLAQGTIYSDVIESSVQHAASFIKSHHNVGGLPEQLSLKIIEPLRLLFKDEVRAVGQLLDLPAEILHRHPFPGPGLGVRILGAITPDKVATLQQADAIFIQALLAEGLYDSVWQAGAILLPLNSVGVMGDQRSYAGVVALRAVLSVDGMTAKPAALPHEFLQQVSRRIINQVTGVNRVVYDISSKPPATIEWE